MLEDTDADTCTYPHTLHTRTHTHTHSVQYAIEQYANINQKRCEVAEMAHGSLIRAQSAVTTPLCRGIFEWVVHSMRRFLVQFAGERMAPSTKGCFTVETDMSRNCHHTREQMLIQCALPMGSQHAEV